MNTEKNFNLINNEKENQETQFFWDANCIEKDWDDEYDDEFFEDDTMDGWW